MIVGDYVYIVTGKGKFIAFNKDQGATVRPKWEYQIQRYRGKTPDIIASPIIADGLLFVTAREDFTVESSKLFCVGEYSPNSEGYIVSSPIHVPNGYWWNKFNAETVSYTHLTLPTN